MASPEVLQTQNDPELGDFSLLAEVEPANFQNGDINHHNDGFNFTNMPSTLAAASSDSIEVVEVHLQLGELIEENSQLKEQLNKNNSMMEDQIITIKSWRDYMISSKNQIEETLKATKENISSLEKENSELRQKLDDLRKVDNAEKINACFQHTTSETDLDNMVAVDNGKENGYIKPEWSFFFKNFDQNLKLVCQILKIAADAKTNQEEKQLLDCYISMLEHKIACKGRTDQLTSFQTDEETGYEVVRIKHEDGTQQIQKLIEEHKQKVQDKEYEFTCLKNEKEVLLERIKEYEMKIQGMEMARKSQHESLTNQLQNESSLSQKYRERCESLQQQIESLQQKIKEYEVKSEQSGITMSGDEVNGLKEEIQQLQGILKLEQKDKEALNTKLFALMKNCEHLQVDHDRIEQLLEIQIKDGKEKDEKLSSLESEIKKYMEEVGYKTAQLLETEEKLEESDTELKKLQHEFSVICEDSEGIPTLKAQIEAYKKDYMELESAKSEATNEVERLKNELQKYEKNDSFRSDSSRNPGSRKSSDQKAEENGYVECPVCTNLFKDQNTVEYHITRCLADHANDTITID